MQHLGVIASVQPFHAVADRDIAERYWGPRHRRAYVSSYVDAETRFAPDRSPPHPTVSRAVTVAPGERFNEDRFPLIDE